MTATRCTVASICGGDRGLSRRASFLTGRGRTLTERLPEFEMHRMALDEGAVLEKGCVYVVPLMERLDLPADISTVANAKSSTGRVDCLTRVITDDGTSSTASRRATPARFSPRICPQSFSVAGQTGVASEPDPLSPGEAGLSDAELYGAPRRIRRSSPAPRGALIHEGLGLFRRPDPGTRRAGGPTAPSRTRASST